MNETEIVFSKNLKWDENGLPRLSEEQKNIEAELREKINRLNLDMNLRTLISDELKKFFPGINFLQIFLYHILVGSTLRRISNTAGLAEMFGTPMNAFDEEPFFDLDGEKSIENFIDALYKNFSSNLSEVKEEKVIEFMEKYFS